MIAFRVVVPVGSAFFYRLRVVDVVAEGPTVTSIRIDGRRVDEARPRPGQFFLWRFLTRGFWWTSHPFSLSEAPDGRTLRISVKAAGDHTSRMRSIPFGTRVVAEGPYGAFTESRAAARQGAPDRGRDRDHAGPSARRDDGGRHVVIYRVLVDQDIVSATS